MKTLSLCLLAVAGVLVGCASAPPAQTEFPPGARAPTAAEAVSLLRGKSFTVANPNGSSTRVDHAADDSGGLTAYFAGRTDTGIWRAEDTSMAHIEEYTPLPGDTGPKPVDDPASEASYPRARLASCR